MSKAIHLTRDGETSPEQLTRELAFEIRADRVDDNQRTVQLTFSSEEPYERWWGTEILDHSAGAVRLDRLNSGGALLMDHNSRDQVGVVERAWIEGRKGHAIVRFGRSARAIEIFQDVKDGIRKLVSVGYRILDLVLERSTDEADTYRARDWEPYEISLVAVPADPTVGVGRDGEPAGFDPRTLVQQENDEMPQARNANSGGGRSPAGDGQVYRDGSPSRARTVTVDQILRACSRANLSREAERQLLEEHERSPMNETQLFDAMLDAVAEQRNATPINANRGSGRAPATRDLFAEALYSRLSGNEASEQARQYVGASIVDMARALLEANGEPVRFARASAVIDAITRAGMHTTSDFAYMVQNATSRFLRDTFRASASPLKMLARPRPLPDFKPRSGVRVEGPGGLRLVGEAGEFKYSSVKESADSIKLATYGEILAISRQALINDDLGVFSDVALFFARAAAETEATYLAALIRGNGVTLSDGQPLYHSSHGNVAATGGAINEGTLAAGLAAMRAQKNLDGETFANVTPRYLVVGIDKEVEAQKAIAAITPATSSNVNPFSERLEIAVDPRLTGNSWRLFADPQLFPVLEWATLDGQEGLFTDTRVGFDVDGVEIKARLDIGAAAWDWRGTYMNPGN